MRDRDIRTALREELKNAYKDDLGTIFIDELGLCTGNARVDMAVVNGSLNGYEIKSERDTLQRLPHQIEIYGRALDQVTIVASGLHIEKIINLVPEWWGVTEAYSQDGIVQFKIIRTPQTNPTVDAFSLVQLLWREEALALLKTLGAERGMMSKPRRTIWRKLTELKSVEELGQLV
ncbi:MAG: sce7726 family protein, partial [Acidobacteriota bacterium]|nr:sce7726 family protein [Acidobacteriota bacterium]